MQDTDVFIHGAGIIGQTLALSLGSIGLRVTLSAPAEPPRLQDVRAYALNAHSVELLRQIKVWDALPSHAVTPVYDMQIEGDAQAALSFSAWQQGLAALAWIVDVSALEVALLTAVQFAPNVHVLTAGQPTPNALLTAISEGSQSTHRDALPGMTLERTSYGQTAIAARVSCIIPHAGVARQWFRSPDVLALLPCTQGPEGDPAYAMVWSLPSERAKSLMALPEAIFEDALNEAFVLASGVGPLRLYSQRSAWPLCRLKVTPWCGPGWVLVGDVAHAIHPLAGQGLNLGLADVASLQRVLLERESWRSLGDIKLLRRYVRARALPTQAMGDLTGSLMHLFANTHPLVKALRNQGLNLIHHFPVLKSWLAQQAL